MKNSKDTNKKSLRETQNNPFSENVNTISDDKPWVKSLIRYGVTILIALVLTFVIALIKKIFQQTDIVEIFHILVDATFVSGTIIACLGLLVLATNGGVFDMLSFGVITFFTLFMKDMSKRKYKTYYDYKEAKKDEKNPIGFLLIVGCAFIAISLIFLLIWYQNGGRSTATEAVCLL